MKAPRRPKPARGNAFGILNPYGDLWTYEHFATEEAARKYIKDFWGFSQSAPDLGKFKVIPVRITVSAIVPRSASTGVAAQVEREGSREAPNPHPHKGEAS